MTLAIDYAWTHPEPSAIKAAGYDVVMRYLSHDPSKDLSLTEAKALHAAGLGIGLVWETTASRAGAGQAAGASDAKEANAAADRLGFPRSCPIFYAVDYDAAPSAVEPYFTGVKSVGVRPIGVYGSYRVVEAIRAKYASHGWQTMAWSFDTGTGRYLVSSHAHLYQRIKRTAGPIAGVADSTWDEDAVLIPFPLWSQGDDMSTADVQAVNAYIRDLLLDGYTVNTVPHPGIGVVVEESQRRIDKVSAKLDQLGVKLDQLASNPPSVDVDALAAKLATLLPPDQPITVELLVEALRKLVTP